MMQVAATEQWLDAHLVRCDSSLKATSNFRMDILKQQDEAIPENRESNEEEKGKNKVSLNKGVF